MRELIEAVKAEAQYIIDSAADNDRYYKEQLQENEHKRDLARERIAACDDALEALNSAAKHLVGSK